MPEQIQLTREVAQGLWQAPTITGLSVEAWTTRLGEPVVAALDAAGLVTRIPGWSGCLALTDEGERIASQARRWYGFALCRPYVTRAEVMPEEEWQRARDALCVAFPVHLRP